MPTSTAARGSKRAARGTRKRRTITPEDLTRLIYISQPHLSHDGTRVLFTRKHVGEKNEYAMNLWTIASDGRDEPAQLTAGDTDSGGEWSPDDSTIAFIRKDKNKGTAQVYLLPTGGGEARPLTDFPEGRIQNLRWSPDGKWLAAVFRPMHPEWTKDAEKKRAETGASTPPRIIEDAWYRLDGDGYFLDQRFAVHLIDAATGKTTKIFDRDALGNYDFDFSPDSRRLLIAANPARNALLKPWNQNLYLVDVPSGKTRKIDNLPKGPKAHVRWSPDGTKIAYAGRAGDDSEYSTENLELFVCDPKKGDARSLTADTDYCLMAITLSDTSEAVFGPNFAWHPDGSRIICQIGWHGESHLASVDVGNGALQFITRGAFDHTLGSLSSKGGLTAIMRADAAHPPEIGTIDVDTRQPAVSMLTSFNRPLLDELELARPTSHWIKSEDGNKIHVWIMRPPGRSSRGSSSRTPGVLEIHGGPHAQYGVPFFHEFQCLAAAGYTVFYSNPRGSKGYGRDHCHAIRGAWGTADWTDIRAVIEFMKSDRGVNPKRMGVMGGSYGGYMTNWIIGHTREFAGAITDRCVSNLVSMWGNSDFPGRENKYWQGNAWDKPEALWKSSPIRHLGNARTPTLIIHSEGDLRCNIEQAEQVFIVLKSKNVPTRFVRYPASTSHGLSRMGPPDLRIHRLHEILNWWKHRFAASRGK